VRRRSALLVVINGRARIDVRAQSQRVPQLFKILYRRKTSELLHPLVCGGPATRSPPPEIRKLRFAPIFSIVSSGRPANSPADQRPTLVPAPCNRNPASRNTRRRPMCAMPPQTRGSASPTAAAASSPPKAVAERGENHSFTLRNTACWPPLLLLFCIPILSCYLSFTKC